VPGRSGARFHGSGPGARSADGCSVEFYRRLTDAGDLAEVEHVLAHGARVLELGCGTGRLTRRLLALGTRVVAVDDCAEMLAHLPAGARPVRARIEALDLPERFDVAVLASGLVNHPDDAVRRAFVAAAGRHLAGGGRFLVQRLDPDWLLAARAGEAGVAGAATVAVEAASHEGDLVSIALQYDLDGSTWRQSFQAVALRRDAVEALLAEDSFGCFAWSGSGRWVCATRAGAV
jgi:SAM-dependent methyltransferase